MSSRFRLFGATLVVLAFSGIAWIVITSSDKNRSAPQQLASPVFAANATTPSINENAQAAAATSAFVPADNAHQVLSRVRALLDQRQHIDPSDRAAEDEIRCALLSLLSNDNAPSIVTALTESERQSEFGVAALTRWASVDVVAASLWLAQQSTQTQEQTWSLAQALTQDALVLTVLCEQLPASPWREALLDNAWRSALANDPMLAIQIANRMKPGADQTRALLTIADDWMTQSPEAASHWIASQSDSNLRNQLVATGAAARASTDPVGSLEWIMSSAVSDDTIERAIQTITTMWADYAPEQAQRFAARSSVRSADPLSPSVNSPQ